VSAREDLEQVNAFTAADMFLLDAKPPPGADRAGGHGRPFDWSILQGFDPGKPWVLSGGLTPDNVAEAVRVSGAKAVDVSSGVEASPGVKDAAKVRAFVAAAKAI
jgi:phosphoribosylanthranilate isomerase